MSTPPASESRDEPPSPIVLLVDDHGEYRQLLGRVLRIEHGLEVLDCGSALAALTLLESGQRVDVLVSDLRMPGLSGADLLDVVGKRWPGVRRALLTAWSLGSMVADAPYLVLDKGLSGWVICEHIADLARRQP